MTPGEIIENTNLKGDYYKVRFYAPGFAEKAQPGMFVHVRIDHRGDQILRRPFSIQLAEGDALSVVYKVVGKGTAELSRLKPGAVCDLLGPRGRGFSVPPAGYTPVAVAGGYGAAATFMLTRNTGRKGLLLLGARSGADVILTEEYEKAGFEVRIATNDGSVGRKGFVTELLPELLAERPGEKFFFCGCGPHPMLMALARWLKENGQQGQLSIDHIMCCGVGACFGCVVKVNDPGSETGWKYARACADGPVFDLNDVYVG